MPKNIQFGPTGYVYGDDFTLVPAGTVKTASGNSGSTGRAVGYIHTLRLALNVTAVSGTTPSMTVTIEHSPDNATWSAHPTGAFTAMTTTGTQRKIISGLDRYVRVSWTISGTTPSFTFGLAGESVGGENTD